MLNAVNETVHLKRQQFCLEYKQLKMIVINIWRKNDIQNDDYFCQNMFPILG